MFIQKIINKIKSNDTVNSDPVPWYFGRKFWGILTGLPFLLSFMFYWKNTYDPFWEKLIDYFTILAEGGVYLISVGISNIPAKPTNEYSILYYIILGLFVYLGFRKKKVNIIFPIIIIIISFIGLAAGLFLSGS